ncbi:hypothetical protein ACN42_g9514 [Penicillium freii]|uniref:DUF7580 domain-containing protein n=1 Tax=Penicillium freii TaxID=48697 RepID=A0A117NLH5_PENFR|nr:hypothetical protein ACN42_g9514 [Penicillium freii]
MSGFEVAGVVLGALPLIITAVDKYKATARILKNFRHKKPHVQRLIQALESQKFCVESEMVIIWNGAFSKEDLVPIPPTSNDFKSPMVALAIQKHLGPGYQPFIAALSRCEEALVEIATHLHGLASDGQGLSVLIQANPPQPNGSYEFTKKIKFALKKDDLERHIKDLENATNNLSRIRDYSRLRTPVTLQSTSSPASRIMSSFDAIRSHACRLYATISTAYAETCHPEHEAHLFLQSRAKSLLAKGPKPRKSPVTFTISFGQVGPDDRCSPSQATKVRILEGDTFTPESTDITLPTGGATTIVQSSSNNPRRVSYQLNAQIHRNSRSTPLTNPSSSSQQPSPPQVIQNLCLHMSKSKGIELQGLHLSKDGQLCYHQSPEHAIQTQLGTTASTIHSLDELLQPTSTIKLYLNSRIALSFKIASSILQLNDTKWYRRPITSDMIYLLCENSGTPGSNHRSFISRKFTPSLEESCALSAKRAMLELGIILLELWKNQTFTSYATESQTLYHTFGARYDLARNWLDANINEILPIYSDVVTRCIECTFVTSGADYKWSDTEFRKSVYDYVIKPLGKLIHPSLGE